MIQCSDDGDTSSRDMIGPQVRVLPMGFSVLSGCCVITSSDTLLHSVPEKIHQQMIHTCRHTVLSLARAAKTVMHKRPHSRCKGSAGLHGTHSCVHSAEITTSINEITSAEAAAANQTKGVKHTTNHQYLAVVMTPRLK